MPSLIVKGMSCEHCRQAVLKALQALPGIEQVEVDLASGKVTWNEASAQGTDMKQLIAAISSIGFDVSQ